MATPIVTTVNKNFNLSAVNKQTLDWVVLDSAGAPLDVDTGYTAGVRLTAASSPFPGKTGYDISSLGTMTFGSAGEISLPLDFADLFNAPLQCARYNYELQISNDSFTTWAVAATGSISLT